MGHNPDRRYDVRINLDLLDDKRIRATINHIWRANIDADTPDHLVGEAWYKAKKAVASYLLWLTKNSKKTPRRQHLS